MGHTYTKLLTHLIFSTKERAPLLPREHHPVLFQYIGGIVRNQGGKLLDAGGMPDHLHLLVITPPRLGLSDLLREVKSGSSLWIAKQNWHPGKFASQTGFSAFSLGQSMVPDLRAYFANQYEHHRHKSFQEELLDFLNRFEVEFDERYLWD